MKEIVHVYSSSLYIVLMITGLISVYQLEMDNSYSFVYELYIAYDFSCILVVLYYFLHLLLPRVINLKYVVFLITHYVIYAIAAIVTLVYYNRIDNDVVHIYIVMFVFDFSYAVIHAKYFYEFAVNPQYYNYEPIIIEKIIKQTPGQSTFSV